MNIVNAWKDSLSLLKPASLKLFVLVVLKGIIQAYKALLYVLPIILFLTLAYGLVAVYAPEYQISLMVILYVTWVIAIFYTYVAARPSVLPKNCSYFRSYTYAFILFALFDLVANMLSNALSGQVSDPVSIALLFKEPLAISPLYGFFILFFLDSYTSIKNLFVSAKRALIMAWYNYPICLLLFVIFYALFNGISDIVIYLLAKLMGHDAQLEFSSLGFNDAVLVNDLDVLNNLYIIRFYFDVLLLPIFVCIITALYVKRVHEDFKRYE